MQQYGEKRIDPKKNILYGSTDHEEFVFFTYDSQKKRPIRVETIGITHRDPNYFIERKHADYFVLEYVKSGKGYVCCEGKNYTVEKDCVYLLQPGMGHKYGADKKQPYEKIWINFFSSVFADLFAAYGHTNKVVFENSGCEKYFEELIAIAEECSDNEEAYLKVSEVLFKIILELCKCRKAEQKQKTSYVANLVKETLDNSIYRKVTIEELAKEINFSKSQMTREFRKYYGSTPYKYLLDRKIVIAKQMLVSTSMRVQEISEALGFVDAYYFSDIFKTKTGLSPLMFRKEQNANKNN